MRYSVQTIKYDLLYAIKEYDSDGSQWKIAVSDRPPANTLAMLGLDPSEYVYVGKPASTTRAAELVEEFFVQRFDLSRCSLPNVTGEWVIMYRMKTSIPQHIEML